MLKYFWSFIVWILINFHILSANAIEHVSVNTAGEPAAWGYSSLRAAISADGRFISFISNAPNLFPGDINYYNDYDLFVHDRHTGTTEHISSKVNVFTESKLSADGRFVVFVNSDNGQVVSFDRETEQSSIISISPSDQPGNGTSNLPSVSSDGRFVAFQSEATNLVNSDTNNKQDIFVHDRQQGITKRVSVSSKGEQGNDWSYFTSISGDGRFVTFRSQANNLVLSDTNNKDDIFVHDLNTGATNRVSVSSQGDQANEASSYPSISSDGNFVIFESTANNLVDGDLINTRDLFVHDLSAGLTERVTVTSLGDPANAGPLFGGSISADGHYIVYATTATNIVPGVTNDAPDVFIHDRLTGETQRFSVSKTGQQGEYNEWSRRASISMDGKFIVFDSGAKTLVDVEYTGPTTANTSTTNIFVTENLFAVDLIGEPVLDQSTQSGVYVWQDQSGYTHVKVIAGGVQENGKITSFAGTILAEQQMNSLTLGSIEFSSSKYSDSLTQTNGEKIEFELFTRRPYKDDFTFYSNSTESLCILLSDYPEGLFLGPDKVQVVSPYDINRKIACDQRTLTVEGIPQINQATDDGLFIWRDGSDWSGRFVAGGTVHEFSGLVRSSSPMEEVIPISIEPPDVVDHLPTVGSSTIPGSQMTFDLLVTGPWRDEFRIRPQEYSDTCVRVKSPENVKIYLGPNRLEMSNGFSLERLIRCETERFEIIGKPAITRGVDDGIFLWQNQQYQWQAEVVSANIAAYTYVLVNSDQEISDFEPVGLEAADDVVITPNQINLTLGLGTNGADGFKFTIQPDSTSCVSSNSYHKKIYLGPNRIKIDSRVNLVDYGYMCN